MAERLSKLRQRILLSSLMLFIFVSVSSGERTRCYWCGPLAEQVHRSQRAPSCNNFHLESHETDCDPGYSHCATVAVSPPYVESRLCVKFYQDECYSLYCNSTKTWRMVCACKGDLCNGPHTDRETQAFALVPKISKTKPRNKRNLVSNFMGVKTRTPAEEDNTIIIIGKELNDTQHILNDQPVIDLKGNVSNPITPTPKRAEDDFIIVHGSLKNVDKTITHNPSSKAEEENDDNKRGIIEPTMLNMEDKHVDAAKNDTQVEDAKINTQVNDTKIDKPHNTEVKDLDYTETGKTETLTKPGVDIIKEVNDSAILTTSMKPTTEVVVAIHTSATTPAKMPPAEALQQNITPTKAIEITTMGTEATSTDRNKIVQSTTLPSKENKDAPKKNNAVTYNTARIIILAIGFLVHYCA